MALFFIVSGYLITKSFIASKSVAHFVLARMLRLLPALAVTLVLLAAVVGPVLTTLTLADYFSREEVARFVWLNLSLTGFAYELPGVFTNLPFPKAVDGSLWTLVYEARCYMLVVALGIIRCLNKWTVAAILGASFIASEMLLGGDMVELGSYFAGGAVMFFWQPRLRGSVALGCIVILLVSILAGGFRLACATAGAYLVIYVARSVRPVQLRWLRGTDMSYGIYLWAFPVQQAVSLTLGASIAWWSNALISTPLVIGLAWMSWRWVEAPALSLKLRWSSKTALATRSRLQSSGVALANGADSCSN